MKGMRNELTIQGHPANWRQSPEPLSQEGPIQNWGGDSGTRTRWSPCWYHYSYKFTHTSESSTDTGVADQDGVMEGFNETNQVTFLNIKKFPYFILLET
jgi:hypothetical protein